MPLPPPSQAPAQAEEFRFSDYEGLLQHPNGIQKFAEVLAGSGKTRLTILHKNLKHVLARIGDVGRRDQYLTVIVQSVLYLAIHSFQIDKDGINDLVNGLVTELRHFSNKSLANCVKSSLEYLKKETGTELPARWNEIFIKMVNLLTTQDDVDFENDNFNGDQFKTEVIDGLLGVDWKANNGPCLVGMLREIAPAPDQAVLRDIFAKVTSSLPEMDTFGVPSMAYQLLLYLGNAHPKDLLKLFDEYFAATEERPERIKTVGSTVFHFIQGARFAPNLVKEMIGRLKVSAYDSSVLVNRFNLAISLGLTQMEQLKQVVVDGLKATIIKNFSEFQFCEDTLWFTQTYQSHPLVKVQESFKKVLESRTSEIEYMMDGLKDLALGLLRVEETGTFAVDECKKLAFVIMRTVVQKNKENFHSIFNRLLNIQNRASIECLAIVLKAMDRKILDSSCINKIHQLINHLPMLTVDMAIPLVKALLPAIQLSSILMNELVMVLRKTLWKSIEARRVSVTAMMMVLSNLRIISNFHADEDQDEFLNDSQVPATVAEEPSTEKSMANQLFCAEIVVILKKFFGQQCEVREQLYLGLDSVLSKNVELINDLSSQLLVQVKQHMTRDAKSMCLSNVLQITGEGDVTILEELGLLFQATCCVLRKSKRVFEGNVQKPAQINECEKLVSVWATSIMTLKTEDFDLQAAELVSKSGETSKSLDVVHYTRNVLMVQILQVIEAMLEFYIFGGKLDSAIDALALYKKFKELQKALKNAMQKDKTSSKTKGTSKKKEKAKEKEKTAMDTTTGSNNTSSTNSEPKKRKLNLTPKIMYTHIISLKSTREILDVFYKNEDPRVRALHNYSFEELIFEIISQKLVKLNKKEPLKEFDYGAKIRVKVLLSVAGVLWGKALNSNPDEDRAPLDDPVIDLDVAPFERINKRLQIILGILQYVFEKHANYRKRIIEFANGLKEDYGKNFKVFLKDWNKLFSQFQNTSEKNWEGSQILLSILNIISGQLVPANDSTEAEEAFKIIKRWVFMSDKPTEPPTRALAESSFNCYITLLMKFSRNPVDIYNVTKIVRYILGDNMENVVDPNFDPQSIKRSWLITKDTALTVFSVLCSWVEKMLKLVNLIVVKVKHHVGFVGKGYSDELRNSCLRLMKLVLDVLTELICCNFTYGQPADLLLKISIQFFVTMNNISENIQSLFGKKKEGFDFKLFEPIIKKIGSNFKSKIESCIHFIELILREEACAMVKAKQSKDKNAKAVPTSMISKFTKDSKNIPLLVYHIERYDFHIISLAKKAQINLLVGTKLSASRDFRIQTKVLKERLRQMQENEVTTVSFNSNITEDAPEDVEMQNEEPNESRPNNKSKRNSKRKTPEPDDNDE